MPRKLFCELGPHCYEISLRKEILLRHIKDFFSNEKFAKTKIDYELPNIVKSHSSILIRRLHGVDIRLQENKVTNIEIACKKINGIVVEPGETFSFWQIVGNTTAKLGYKEGMAIGINNTIIAMVGGGICQMGNMIHWLILNSPLKVTELHHHSDALFPDERRRVPFGTGTSISYNNLDYRFYNDTDQKVQILVWCENGELCGELRSEKPFPNKYKLVEEDHHFSKEGNEYFRISKIYREIIDRKTNITTNRELILNNHSKVMYDYNLIPKEQIRND